MKFGILLSATFADAAKILCLHGGGQTASGMQWMMTDFESALPEFEFVYAQTPEPGNVWIVDPPSKDEPTTDPHWADNSFNYLDNLIETQGPFYGLCGYSQGSAFIPVYLAHRGGGSGVTSTQSPGSSSTNGGTQSTTKPTDSTTTNGGNGNSCSGETDYPCSNSGDCWNVGTCCDDGYCNFDDKDRSTGSDFNRVVLFNGYLPTTHQGLMGILNGATPLTTPAFVFSGGQDPFGPMAPDQAAQFSTVIHRESANVGHNPPPTSDPNFQQVVNFIRAGLTDTTTQGTGGTSSQTTTQSTTQSTGVTTTKTTTLESTTHETTTKTTPETTTKFDPSVYCPDKGTMVDWKGSKNSRILFRSTTGVLMRVNFFNNVAAYDLTSDTYLGFLGFSKNMCGIDFIRALGDGRVSTKMYDYGAYYDNIDSFTRMDGRQTSFMLAFDRNQVGAKDLPGGNKNKKDQLYLTIEGLDQVDFGTKDADTCLQAVQCGTMPSNEIQEHLAACAAWDKDLGW